MSTALATIGNKLSNRFGMGDNQAEVMNILKDTAFKGGNVSDAQMTALMVVADQYGLNPFTKEIYAFPDKGGIVPVVGVDGWSRIINEHPQFDGLEFVQDDESCTCIMYRKDRSHAIKVTEYVTECLRPPMNGRAGPWQSHPKRMMRHKSLIQCARLAFGFVGIYDQDEAERIVEIDVHTGEIVKPKAYEKPALEYCSEDNFAEKAVSWNALIESGKKTADQIISMVESKYLFTADQKEEIRSWKVVTVEGELV